MNLYKTSITLKGGYAGLVDVVGGKLWYVYNDNTKETYYFSTKRETEKKVREVYTHNKEMRNAILNQLIQCRGRVVNYLY